MAAPFCLCRHSTPSWRTWASRRTDSDAAHFLMDNVHVSREHGLFSYEPLLQMLGLPTPYSGGGDDVGGHEEPPPSGGAASPRPSLGEAISPQPGCEPIADPPRHAWTPRSTDMASTPADAASPGTEGDRSFPLEAAAAEGRAARAAPPLQAAAEDPEGSAAARPEETEQEFWARQGPGIQRLFSAWDANQLANEAFLAMLQSQLGDRVDISRPDSEFLYVTNKHRSARNMGFAALMSALRRDANLRPAQDKALRRADAPAVLRQVGGGALLAGRGEARLLRAPHFSGRRHAAMHQLDCASQASVPPTPLHAAGKATGAVVVPGAQRGGRKHYPYGSDLGDSSIPPSPGAESRIAWGEPPTGEGSCSSTLRLQTADSVRPGARAAAALAADAADDARSVGGESVLSELTRRDRRGHGNILTWGGDSRDVTPTRRRLQGRAPGQQRRADCDRMW
ncbi:unnamed protein product [Prorocentrum cordatum]|uniref:Uncharacterized protein n=1 Tax=Prorocentrum cordatum TaxID=2364126 RepID=A0ABN9QKY7_9DINO|nr:unnamed protein product [Polarella glacialis]